MEAKKKFTVGSLVVVLLLNGILLASAAVMAGLNTTVLGVGVVLTLLLWLAIQRMGAKLIEQAPAPAAVKAPKAPEVLPPKPVAPPKPAEPREAAALQILSILQRRGRLIDFLQEDLSQFQDAQIGAAVRNIHEGCKAALAEYVDLEPIYSEAEGSAITVQPGFNAHAVRLTGSIKGDPPFKGALRHRGWRVARIELPERVQGGDGGKVVAPAEVEVQG